MEWYMVVHEWNRRETIGMGLERMVSWIVARSTSRSYVLKILLVSARRPGTSTVIVPILRVRNHPGPIPSKKDINLVDIEAGPYASRPNLSVMPVSSVPIGV
jgi:hypothetical protein